MTDMKCPFCQQELVRHWGMEEPALYCCDNPKCSRGGVATESSWQELIHTRKALDVANEKLRHCVNMTVEELDELKGNLIIAYDALLHFSKDPIANNALKKITTLEQKDVK